MQNYFYNALNTDAIQKRGQYRWQVFVMLHFGFLLGIVGCLFGG